MKKKTAAKRLTYKQALFCATAETLRSKVDQPRILTLGELIKAVSGLPSTKAIFGHLSSSSVKPKRLSNAKSLKSDLDGFSEISADTPTYVVLKQRNEPFSAWPILWAGEQDSKFLLIGYHDPVRFGFPSESTGIITIGPNKPWSIQDRQFGVFLACSSSKSQKSGYKVIMEPMGERLTARTLKSRYGFNWQDILGESLTLLDDEGKNKVYRSRRPLPSLEEFQTLVAKKYTKTIANWVDEAFHIIEELGDDLRDAFENTPASLQYSELGMARDEAASILEELAHGKPEIPKQLKRREVFVQPPKKRSSRRDRANEAADILEALSKEVAECSDLCEDQEIEEFTSQLEEAISNLEDVEFPGMYS